MKSERSLAAAEGGARATRPRTREALLDAALESFSRDGFRGTSIRDLARTVGIRESSVYKHFPSKQAILDALIERADDGLAEFGARLGVDTATGFDAAEEYRGMSEERLLGIAHAMFDFVLHDPGFAPLRRLLTIEQFRDPGASARFRDYLIERPLVFQTELFGELITAGELRPGLDPRDAALAFFGPIHLLIQLADGSGDDGAARALLEAHVRHFRRTHLRAS